MINKGILFLSFVIVFTSCREEESGNDDTNDVTYCETLNTLKFSSEKFIFIPNLYSPNNDGINDIIYIYSKPEMKNLSFNVFNQAGDTVFTSQKDSIILWTTPYLGKQVFTKDEVLHYELDCSLDSEQISTTGKITLLHEPENELNTVENCDSCYFGDMIDNWSVDTFKLHYTNEVISCAD